MLTLKTKSIEQAGRVDLRIQYLPFFLPLILLLLKISFDKVSSERLVLTFLKQRLYWGSRGGQNYLHKLLEGVGARGVGVGGL